MPKHLTRWYLPIYLLFNSLALTLAGLAATAVNAEFQSTARTALTAGTFAAAGLALVAGLWFVKGAEASKLFANKVSTFKFQAALNLSLGLLFALAWGLAWLPAEKTGNYYYYFVGVQPLLLWIAFASGFALLLSLTLSKGFSLESGLAHWRKQKFSLQAASVILVIFGLIAAALGWLKIWASEEPYWYGAGAPLLAWQVYVLVLAAILLWQIRFNWPRHTDILLFFAIWGVSAYFWASQPLQASFFITPPMFPNHEFYPFADLEFFDRASQYALIGQGINNGQFYDRALYIAFLVYLHTFFGQNHELLMKIQAGLFAVFPAVVYLIGKNLHGRPPGLIAAALASWRGTNALAAMALINTSTAKHMLTDFPTGLGLAIFCLFLIQWIKDPQKNWHKAALGAGTLGLTSLLRPHVMALLVVFLPLIALVSFPKWRTGLAAASLGLLAFFASISPWTFLSGSNTSIIELYATRIRGVIEQRYIPEEQQQIPALPAKPGLLAIAAQAEQPIDAPFPVNHFLNNLQTSALGLPLAPQLLSTRETIKGGETIWQVHWQGDLSSQAVIMLSLSLGLTALGIGAAMQKSRLAGLALPVVFLIYAAANALARTSGGRYIVPIDWIVVLFFGLGLTVLIEASQTFFSRQITPAESAPPAAREDKLTLWWVKAAGVLVFFGLIGGLIPLSEHIHSPRYTQKNTPQLLNDLDRFLPQAGLNREMVETFLRENSKATILQGRALYPRFFHQGDEFISWEPYKRKEYPRTILVVLGPKTDFDQIVLTGPPPSYLPNASDVIVLGCSQGEEFFNTHALLVVLPNEKIIYQADPERPLQCPIQEPICNNNKYCR